MQTFTQFHLSDVPLEEAHGGTGARQVLVKPEHVVTNFLDAITKGFLKSGSMFDWHNHTDTDEVFIVTQGQGKFYYKQNGEEGVFEYAAGDTIIAPANEFHKIVAEGDEETQGFFVRVKDK